MEPHIVALYNPANAKNLSESEIEAMKNFTREDITTLAQAYPNTATGGTYLVLYDKTKKDREQLYPKSTWKNLLELLKVGQIQFIPWTFASLFSKKRPGLKVADTQDLSNQEAKEEVKAAGNLTKAPDQNLSESKDSGSTANQGEAAAQDLKETTETGKEAEGGTEKGSEENGGSEEGKPVVYNEKDFNKAQLQAAYKEKFTEDPDNTWTKKELVDLLNGSI